MATLRVSICRARMRRQSSCSTCVSNSFLASSSTLVAAYMMVMNMRMGSLKILRVLRILSQELKQSHKVTQLEIARRFRQIPIQSQSRLVMEVNQQMTQTRMKTSQQSRRRSRHR